MKTWDAASSKIKKRKVIVWQELSVQTPFEYDPSDPDAYFSSFLEENAPEAADIVLDRVDRDRLWAAEIVVTTQKFLHVLRLTEGRAREGHVTWASTDAHHALLLGVRCFLATLGVGICQGRNRAHLVDFRPEKGRPQDEKAFKKQHRNVVNPLRVLTPTPKNIDQRQIFELFNRMLRVAVHEDSSKILVENLERLKLGAHKSERNRLLYQSSYWHWLEDLNWPAIEFEVRSEIPKGADGLTRDFFAVSLVADLVLRSINPLSSKLRIQKTFFEPLGHDGSCVADTLSFLRL
ncbi:hypothetical protein GGR95_003807 [Sulfitobacter undariae]|uniref:Uncharacterized protein n=1 Tax=Sulfitobacter undariae TaxID=1563671 RepID=A0A7W6H3R5_9RHOB|nr:hypothetical protein [Sulfitobacter undariae]MBB3996139.1 hypothetical protein [Sulfitobacter undariae]